MKSTGLKMKHIYFTLPKEEFTDLQKARTRTGVQMNRLIRACMRRALPGMIAEIKEGKII